MKVGDLVVLPSGVVGIVRKLDTQVRTAFVQTDATARMEEVADDLDETEAPKCRVICNPSISWPFLRVPDRPRLGHFVRPMLPRTSGVRELKLFHEWVATGVGSTVSIFLDPVLGVKYGDMLLAVYEKGTGRIMVPPTFGTVASKMARTQVKEERKPVTAYDRLMEDD